MADRINRPNFEFTIKTSPLGAFFLSYEQERDWNRKFSADTCEIHEAVWNWFGPALDQFDAEYLRFRSGGKRPKPMSAEERKEAEKRIFDAIKTTLYAKNQERLKETGKPYSPVTVNIYLRSLATWFKWLVKEGVLVNDFREAFNELKQKESDKARPILMPSEAERFINFKPSHKSMNQSRAWTGGMLMLAVGVRLDELLDLRVNDFEFRDQLLVVNHGKGDLERRIRLEPSIIAVLLKYQTRFINPALTNPCFFGTKNGKKMRDDNFRRDLKVVLGKAGIVKKGDSVRITPHSFRHTAGTAMLVNTGDIYRTQHTLGHRQLSTTQKYVKLAAELMRKLEGDVSALSSEGKFRQLANK